MFAGGTERVVPSEIGLTNVAEVTLTTSGGHDLYSWYGAAEEGQPTFLFLHGNGGAVSDRGRQFRLLMSEGFGVSMVGYPGFGGSEGSPSEPGLIEAAELAYEHVLSPGLRPEDIVIHGKSLGTAVAVQLAAARPARALILAAPMSSVVDIAAGMYPYAPVRWVLRDPFRSIDHIAKIDMPLLIVHGDADEVISYESGRELFSKAREPKMFHTLEGAGHNNIYDFGLEDVMTRYIRR